MSYFETITSKYTKFKYFDMYILNKIFYSEIHPSHVLLIIEERSFEPGERTEHVSECLPVQRREHCTKGVHCFYIF